MPCHNVAGPTHSGLLEMEMAGPHTKECLKTDLRYTPHHARGGSAETLDWAHSGRSHQFSSAPLCSISQHGYLPHHGTDTANLQLINTLESAWKDLKPLYGCSWDMSRAFDSVSKPLIVLCWQRKGLPVEIAQWLVDLDATGYTIVRNSLSLSKWDVEGSDGIFDLSFNPERDTGQGDIHSPFTWLAVFDALLTVLDNQSASPNNFMLRRPDTTAYPARPIFYADDLQSFSVSLPGLQITADLVSVCAMVFNLNIAGVPLLWAAYTRG